MRAVLILLCALATATFSGRAFAATSTQEHSYGDRLETQTAAAEDALKASQSDQTQILSIYAGRQSYAPEAVGQEQGNLHSIFDAVRVGVNFKFD